MHDEVPPAVTSSSSSGHQVPVILESNREASTDNADVPQADKVHTLSIRIFATSLMSINVKDSY